MLRLSTFCLLLTLAVAQKGYEYNKPGKPFGQDVTQNRPGFGRPTSSFPNSPTTPSYLTGSQNDENQGSTQGFLPGSSGYPSGPNQGYPGSSNQRPQKGQGQSPTYSEQGSTGSSNQGYGGSTGSSNQDYPGSTSTFNQGYQGSTDSANQGYEGSTGIANQGSTGSTNQGYQGSVGTANQGYQESTGSANQGTGNYQGQGQNYPGLSGQRPGQPGLSGFGSNTFSDSGAPSTPVFGTDITSSGLGAVSGSPAISGNGDNGAYENGDYSAIPGEPDVDYPILSEIPETSFRCDAQAYPGYYADVETRCQVFHVCANNRTYDFLCPNGTIFSQQVFVCVWWNQFDCNSAPSLYELNANLYDYSKTGSSQDNFSGLNDISQGSPESSPFPGQQESTGNYQGTSGSYPENTAPQGPQNPFQAPNQGSLGYPQNNGNGNQESENVYPGSSGSSRPSTSYPGNQRPSGSYPTSVAPQGPSSGYPGSSPQKPTGLYQGNTRPVSQSAFISQDSPSYPGSSSTQGSGSQTSNFKPQTPTSSYPSNTGYPGSQTTTSFQGSAGGSLGYPSGKPNGPSFPSGRPQGPSKPNREYLPPRN